MDANFYNFFATTMRDDRGRKVRCQHVSDLRSSRQQPREWVLLLLTIISVFCVLFVLLQAGAWLIASFMQSSPSSFTVLRPSVVSVLVAAFFSFTLWSSSSARAQRANDRREVLLAQGRCGACGYDLSSAAPASDGMHQCPECSAAWALEAWKPLPNGNASDYAKSRRNN